MIGADYDAPVVGELPAHPDFDSETGRPAIEKEDSPVREPLFVMVDAVADRVGAVTRRQIAEHVAEREDAIPSATET